MPTYLVLNWHRNVVTMCYTINSVDYECASSLADKFGSLAHADHVDVHPSNIDFDGVMGSSPRPERSRSRSTPSSQATTLVNSHSFRENVDGKDESECEGEHDAVERKRSRTDQ